MHGLAAAGETGAGHRSHERLVHRGEEAEGNRGQHDPRLHELSRRRHRPVDLDDLERHAPQERLSPREHAERDPGAADRSRCERPEGAGSHECPARVRDVVRPHREGGTCADRDERGADPAAQRETVENERQKKPQHDRRGRSGSPDADEMLDRRPADARAGGEGDADDGKDQDLNRRGRHPKAVEEGRDRKGDADHDDLLTHREPSVRQTGADPLFDLVARERRAEEGQRRHEEQGLPGADRPQRVRHPHHGACVVRADAPREPEREHDEERRHSARGYLA